MSQRVVNAQLTDDERSVEQTLRPQTLDEVVGQDHLLVEGSPLRRLVSGDGGIAGPASLILWGPPGT